MEAKILWVEGSRVVNPSLIPKLRTKSYQIEIVSTGKDAVARVNTFDPDLIVINAAALRTSGIRICKTLRDETKDVPLILISEEGEANSAKADANAILELPFTVRKLENRIIKLLPGGSERIMQVGVMRLDLERRIVWCQKRKANLTPRLTRLLRMLMENPGEVIDRKYLFRRVWRTDYVGDTRTLDVHISWLRHAIEANPRKPQFLITIRGVGYRLDV